MILSFLPWWTQPAEPDMAALVSALNDLVVAQREEIAELKRCLLAEKRVSRDTARLAVAVCDEERDDLLEIARDMHRQLADRVAREEEHTL